MRSGDDFVPRDDLDALKERQAALDGEIASLRSQNAELVAQIGAGQGATGPNSLSGEISRLRQENAKLSTDFKDMTKSWTDRNRAALDLERRVVEKDGLVARLQAESADRVSATESRLLRTEIERLKGQVAQAASEPRPPAEGGGDLRLLYGRALEAVRLTAQGNAGRAAEVLRESRAKAPDSAALEDTLALLQKREPAPEPTAKPPTPKPTARPETAAGESKPTATPRPRREPTQAPVAKLPAAAPTPPKQAQTRRRLEPAVPRQIGRAEAARPASRGTLSDPEVRRAYEEKFRLFQQAQGLYLNRRLPEAKSVLDRAYRIDPNDPTIQKLRDRIQLEMAR